MKSTLIFGDSTFCKIRTEQIVKGLPEDPITEDMFGWIIHRGVDYTDNKCMYIKEASDYKKLYKLGVGSGEQRRGESVGCA